MSNRRWKRADQHLAWASHGNHCFHTRHGKCGQKLLHFSITLLSNTKKKHKNQNKYLNFKLALLVPELELEPGPEPGPELELELELVVE